MVDYSEVRASVLMSRTQGVYVNMGFVAWSTPAAGPAFYNDAALLLGVPLFLHQGAVDLLPLPDLRRLADVTRHHVDSLLLGVAVQALVADGMVQLMRLLHTTGSQHAVNTGRDQHATPVSPRCRIYTK